MQSNWVLTDLGTGSPISELARLAARHRSRQRIIIGVLALLALLAAVASVWLFAGGVDSVPR